MKKVEVLASLVIIMSAVVVGVGNFRGESVVKVEAKSDGDYLACGCNCCNEGRDADVKCVTDAAELQLKMNEDRGMRRQPNCASAACLNGVRYKICK